MKQMKFIVLLSTIGLLSLLVVQYASINTTLKYNKEIEEVSLHSKKVGLVYAVLNQLLNIETGGRGYLLTGNSEFLNPYEVALKKLPEAQAELRKYVSKEEADSLDALIKYRVDFAAHLLAKKNNGESITSIDLQNGKVAMDKIRAATAVIINREQTDENKISYQPKEQIALKLVGGSLFSFFLVSLCIYYVMSEFKKRIKTEKDLQVSLATSEAISRDIDFGIIACDVNGGILFTNTWINNRFPDLMVVKDFFSSNELLEYPLMQLLKGDIDTIVEAELEVQGQKKIFTINSAPFQIKDIAKGVVLSIIDTTDSTKKIATLVTGKQTADTASRAKSDFLAKMSHEIRTPLNAILGVGEILSLSKLDSEQEKCLDIFKRSAITLNNLVNDILDLSKIEAGKIELAEAPFSLGNLVNSCTSIMDFRASQKGLLFTADVESEFDHFVGDEGRIRQIVLNLLSNAIKFTEKGEVKFVVRCEDSGHKKNLYFTVRDSGKGISSENINKLFSNYQQETSSISKEYGGTGLGLSLSRELARLMGGDITIKSELGVGSAFTFQVSLSVAEGAFIEENIESNLKFDHLRVLLVDDNQENRFIVKKYLSDFDIEIIEAIDGEDAIEKFTMGKYDLVFMDINMPKKDGIQATKELREFEYSKSLPQTLIIALSANALTLEYTKAMEAGCDDYLTKPISRVRLISMIKKWVKPQNNVATKAEIEELLNEDNDDDIDADIRALIPTYIASRVKDIETIKAALANNEIPVIAKLVHNMKGTALSYGQTELDKMAKEMEMALQANNMDEVQNYILKIEELLKVKNGH